METNEAEILSEVFDDNLSDIPSENEDADDSFEDCEDDSSDSEIIRPVKKSKVVCFQVIPTLTKIMIIVGLKLTHHHAYKCLKVILGSLHFHLSVTL